MSILHQYHKASGLKSWTAMCRSEEKWGNIFKMAGGRFVIKVFSAVWGGGYCCSEIHQKSMHVMLIMVWSTQGYNSLDDPTMQAA